MSTVAHCLWYDILSITFYLYHNRYIIFKGPTCQPPAFLIPAGLIKSKSVCWSFMPIQNLRDEVCMSIKMLWLMIIICWMWHIGYGTFVVTLLDRLIMPTTCNILCIPHDTIRDIAFCCNILVMPHYLCIPSYVWHVGWERLDWTYGSSYICCSLMAIWYRIWAYCLQHISCHRLDRTHLPWHPRYDRLAVTCCSCGILIRA